MTGFGKKIITELPEAANVVSTSQATFENISEAFDFIEDSIQHVEGMLNNINLLDQISYDKLC